MNKRPTVVNSWLVAAIAFALLVAPVSGRSIATKGPWTAREPRRDADRGPAPARALIIGETSWTDPLDDTSGLSFLEKTQQSSGQVTLSQAQPLSAGVSGIRSLVEGPDGLFYMGTDESRLWSYDPATGITSDLGAPVPDECNN